MDEKGYNTPSTPEQNDQAATIFVVILILGIVGSCLGLGQSDSCYDPDPRIEAFCEANR